MRRLLAVLNDKTFDGIREISESEYLDMQENMSILNTFKKDYERLVIVANALKAYEDTIAAYSRDEITYNELFRGVVEKLLNFEATFRSVLDHWETHIKRTYGGKESNEAKAFKQATGKEYDEHFSYRFIYELRNYTLHCDVPISRASAKLHPNGTKTVEVIIKRDKLLETYDWPKKVKLEEMPEEFEIHVHIKQAFECLSRIHQACLNIGDTKKVYEAALKIYKLKSDNKAQKGEFSIVHFKCSDLSTPTSLTQIPINIAAAMLEMLVGK